MKICFLADGKHINTISWVNYLANVLGHEIHLISFGKAEIPSKKVKFYSLGPASKVFLRYIIYIPKLKKLISEISPDILIGYRITSYGFMAACTKFHPLVLAAQGQNIIPPNSSKAKAYFSRYAIRRADLIHSWGIHMTQKLKEFGAKPEKILILPRGIDINLFIPLTERSSDLGCYKLITTRGLNSDYNFDQILHAISILITSMKNFKYIFAGDGQYKSTLVQKVKTLGLESYVDFVGKVEHEKLPLYLQSADLYVSAVSTDGVSASLLEAMACGVFPIVINNAANRLWIEDGINGYLVNNGDYEELARKIRLSLEDIGLREKAKGINRKLVVEKASIEKNMKEFETMWKKLISS